MCIEFSFVLSLNYVDKHEGLLVARIQKEAWQEILLQRYNNLGYTPIRSDITSPKDRRSQNEQQKNDDYYTLALS